MSRDGSPHPEQEALLQRWQEALESLAELADRLGTPLDQGIIETVAGLNVHQIPTRQSCEGHDDHGEALPWIDIETDEPSDWQDNETAKKAWMAANREQAKKVQSLLNQWYEQRLNDGDRIDTNAMLTLRPKGIFGAVRLEPSPQSQISALTEDQRHAASAPSRQEMQRFTEFLRQHFLGGSL